MNDGDALAWSVWADPDRQLELIELLVDRTDLEHWEAETILAYFAEPEHGFTGRAAKWTPGEVAGYYRDRHDDDFESWGALGERWIDAYSGGEVVLTKLSAAADGIGNATELHEIIAAIGRDIAAASGGQWWYETGLLADGRVVRMHRPEAASGPAV